MGRALQREATVSCDHISDDFKLAGDDLFSEGPGWSVMTTAGDADPMIAEVSYYRDGAANATLHQSRCHRVGWLSEG